jgi:hypothetical protein
MKRGNDAAEGSGKRQNVGTPAAESWELTPRIKKELERIKKKPEVGIQITPYEHK